MHPNFRQEFSTPPWPWPLFLLLGLIFAAGCGEPERSGKGSPNYGPITTRELQVPPLQLHPASAMVRIGGPTGVTLPPAADTITLERAENEWCALQVAVTLPAGDPTVGPEGQQVFFDCFWSQGSLDDPGAARQRHLYQVLPIQYRGPAENKDFQVPPGNEGWIPDYCIPPVTEQTGGLVLWPSSNTPLNFLLEIPPTDLAGTAELQFWLRRRWGVDKNTFATEAVVSSVKIRLVTHPVRLPDRFDFMTATTWNFSLQEFLGREPTAVERRRLIDFFLRYRLTPAQFFSKGPGFSDEEIVRIRDGGGTLFQVFHLGGGGAKELTDKQKADFKPKLEAWRKTFIDLKVGDRCYALIADEPPPAAVPVIRKNAEWLKSVWPELKIWAATRPVPELLDVVDAWDVVTAASTDMYARHSHTADGLALARGAKTKPQYWWFYSVEPYRPEPNCRLDNDLIDSRSIGWRSFAAGVDGFEYFWATHWSGNPPPEGGQILPVNLAKWNCALSGAGQLCYPGGSKADLYLLPSLRLINLRDAFEDWQLFRMAAAKDPHCFDGLTPDLKDPQAIEDLRRRAFAVLDPAPAPANQPTH